MELTGDHAKPGKGLTLGTDKVIEQFSKVVLACASSDRRFDCLEPLLVASQQVTSQLSWSIALQYWHATRRAPAYYANAQRPCMHARGQRSCTSIGRSSYACIMV